MNEWYVEVTLVVDSNPIEEADKVFEFTELLGSTPSSLTEDSVTTGVFIEADLALDAFNSALERILHAANQIYTRVEVVRFETMTQQQFNEKLEEPLWPEFVGYAEIARMTGVTRQTAAGYLKTKSFPRPAITTAQGPLFVKSEIERWLENRAESRTRVHHVA